MWTRALRLARTPVVVGVAAALCFAALAQAAARRADLRSSSLSNPPAELAPGASFQVLDAVKNSGTAKARGSVTRFFLSLDRRFGKTDVRLVGQRKVKALRPRKTSRGTTRLQLPAVLPSAAYYLVACSDAAKRVREKSERNNCRASAARTMVTAGGGGPGGPNPGPEPGPQPGNPGGGGPADTDGDGYIADDCAPSDPAIHPGAEDLPDGSFADANCDGMDGEEAKAVFVAVAGADTDGCGARNTPCATIQKGIDEADAQAKRDVYVSAGDYTRFFMRSGRNVYGGFGTGFERTMATAGGVSVDGGADPVLGELATVRAQDMPAATRLADMTLNGADATDPGQSTYTLYASDASLILARVTINAGDGAPGDAGADGDVGDVGGDGDDASGTSGGVGGSAIAGCDGGTGANAPSGVSAGSEGDDGSSPPGGGTAGQGGGAGSSGSCSTTSSSNGGDAPPPGQPGGPTAGGVGPVGSDGTGAAAAPAGGLAETWLGAAGGTGAKGGPGGGGGGGGSGGGTAHGTNYPVCTSCSSVAGGAGGGGGGGGDGGTGGSGGDAGGGSFGIYLWDATLVIEGSTVDAGTGGDGGDAGGGGTGGTGGSGALGAAGVTHVSSCSTRHGGNGADGADGGQGGSGGPGGGGAGGPSIGIVEGGTSSADIQSTTISAGTPGSGGTSSGAGEGANGIAAQQYDGS
jgi:hypothetical protein